jgi:arylesterase/paraoxonase
VRRLLYGLAGLGIVVAAGAAFVAVEGGVFRSIEPHFAGRCTAVGGVTGAEDIVIDHASKRAWISAEDRRANMRPESQPVRGKLLVYDLNDAAAQPIDVTPRMPIDFHPHGISLWIGPDGKRTLFVINHQSFGGHRVEVFEATDDALAYLGGVVLADLKSPNAIAAVGDRQFYVANDQGSVTPFGRWLERTFALPRANVVYFDGQGSRIVADGLRFPAGIEVSDDGLSLWVAEATGRTVRTYRREPIGGSLKLAATTPLDTAPDNLRRDDKGAVWVAAHPKLLALMGHLGDAQSLSPSQVLKLSPHEDGLDAEEVFLDGGETLSAASVAAVSGRRMLIGAIMDPRILDCTLP